MTISRGGQGGGEGRKLRAAPESMREVEDGFEVAVRLTNPLDRAIHYISEVRGLIFDPATRRLRVLLSEQELETPPGGIAMRPRFRRVDPGADAVATIRLPKTIVKLAETPSPSGDLLFEEHAVGDATSIELAIGWSDTPYYDDPREQAETPPITAWEQDTTTVTFSPEDRGEPTAEGTERE